jgi:hypothetical protein
VIVAPIGPRRLSRDFDGVDLFRCPEHEHTPEAFAAEPLQGALELGTLSSHDVRSEVPIGPPGVAIQAELLRHVEDDGDREHVVGASELNERSTNLALHVVASTTVSLPAASRLPAMKCRASKASFVADWSFSSSETRPLNASEESTSVGRKWRAANVDFPEPDGPTSTTSESLGIDIVTG